MSDHLLVEQSDHVLVVTMNRPEVYNAWSGDMLDAMAEAWDRLDTDPDLRCAILTGAGGNFCSGADLKDMSSRRSSEGGDDGFAENIKTKTEKTFRALLRSFRPSKPIIAAVEGYALAGGTEILQATEIRVAGASSTFGLTEVQRSLFPLGGSTVRLQRQVPFTKAMEILLLGENLSAQAALEMGLIGRIVDDGQALAEAHRLADRIARNGPLAVQGILRSARAAAAVSEAEGLQLELQHGMQVFMSEDAKEGPRAFAEKREPNFQGK